MVNLIVKQERTGAIEPFYRQQTNSCCSSAVDKHLLSATENERLNSNKNFVQKSTFQHEAVYRSATEHGHCFVFCKQRSKINIRGIHESYASSARHRFQAV